MFRKILRIFNFFKLKYQNEEISKGDQKDELIPLYTKDVKIKLEEVFTECSDFTIREIALQKNPVIKLLIAFIDGLIDKEMVNRDILRPLMTGLQDPCISSEIKKNRRTEDSFYKESETEIKSGLDVKELLTFIRERTLNVYELDTVENFNQSIKYILSGDTVIYIEGKRIALKAGTRGWQSRGVEEPDTESVVRGPREGFTETLRTNTSLLRRKVKNPDLKTEKMTLGRQTNTDVTICYIKGLIHEDIITTLKRRLKKIKTDAILESGYIEEFIEDAPLSIFPTVANSEKPDVIAGKILEGRAAILCEGTPFVLTVPHLFIESLIAAEDYYTRPFFATLNRVIRIIALVITTTLPSLYVALVAFHQDIIPLKLLLTIAASREGIPFSVFTETLLMAIVFELLREAGVRMPRPIGQAVSIVGALVLGQAAVEAGVASNPVIMITALTAITSFVLPALTGAIPFIRFMLVIAANIYGLVGLSLGIVFIILHMCSLRSFGIPYLAPFSPLNGMDLKDTFIRVPLWSMWLRPRSLMVDHLDYIKKGYRMKRDFSTKED